METNVEVQAKPEVIINETIDSTLSNKEITAKLLAREDTKKVSGVVKKIEVGSLTTSEDGYDYYPVTITLKEGIDAYLVNDNQYALSKSPLIFTNLDVLASILRENDDVAYLVNSLVRNPSTIEMLLTGATLDVIQQDIPAGKKFYNPYSTRAKEYVCEHNLMNNNICDIKMNARGMKLIGKLEDKMLEASVII